MHNLTNSAIACAFVILVGNAHAQQFPTKAVRIIAPFPAGGATDINVRRLAERLNKLWGQPVIVDNSAGGAGISAAVTVAKSKPDGYTLFFITHPILSINPLLYDKLPYDADKDFRPVVEVTETPSVLLVSPALQVANVAELISVAKAKPGTLSFGSGGVGTTLHLSGELFKAAAGIDIVHVPYKGGAADSAHEQRNPALVRQCAFRLKADAGRKGAWSGRGKCKPSSGCANASDVCRKRLEWSRVITRKRNRRAGRYTERDHCFDQRRRKFSVEER